ncbi:hypothetical protein [Faecalimicrobium dakarense]|uniref:hypothetical protein n=1 Tax=Faecalimicrobium dakarense TaxID=1301100 RepID=UPI0004B73675|nr:hypothetical protein [[Clostridium] dakarense]
MDNIMAQRNKLEDGSYNLSLEVADSAYFNIYDNADKKSGEELLRNYLKDNSDDGRYENVKVNHNKNRHLVNITAKLNYDSNLHTEYENRATIMYKK